MAKTVPNMEIKRIKQFPWRTFDQLQEKTIHRSMVHANGPFGEAAGHYWFQEISDAQNSSR